MVWVDRLVHAIFGLGPRRRTRDYRRRDRRLAAEAAALLICQLLVWLAVAYLGFTLMLWPFVHGGLTLVVRRHWPGHLVHRRLVVHGAAERVIQYGAGFFGLVTVTLQIAYLPTLYSAFNRREQGRGAAERAGRRVRGALSCWPGRTTRSGRARLPSTPCLTSTSSGSAGPRTSRRATRPTCRWSGSCSPRPLSSWVTALLAVLDSAAMYLALSPEAAPTVAARLCLRGGFDRFNQVARDARCADP